MQEFTSASSSARSEDAAHATGTGTVVSAIHREAPARRGRCSRARLDGYRVDLETAGLAFDPALVLQGEFDYESGFRAGEGLFALPEPPTAVFADSDQMALGVYEALRRGVLRVPDDVSVVGFDDLPEQYLRSRGVRVPEDIAIVGFDDSVLATMSAPSLTTVRQPVEELGRTTTWRLLAQLAGERHLPPSILLPTELILRSSA